MSVTKLYKTLKYRLLSKITFGSRRVRYKAKYNSLNKTVPKEDNLELEDLSNSEKKIFQILKQIKDFGRN